MPTARIVGMHYPKLSEARASVIVNMPDVMTELVLAADYKRRLRSNSHDEEHSMIMENLAEAERLLVKMLSDVREAMNEQRRGDPEKTKVIFIGEKT